MFLSILTLLFIAYIVDGTDEFEKYTNPPCKQLNDLFIKKSHDFTHCVLTNNENATYCEDCVEDYASVWMAFNDLMTSNETDHTEKQGSCRSRYIDANQLNLVETVLGHSKQLWTIGDCSGEISFKFHLYK